MNIMSLRSHLRFHTALQLSLALESAEETLVGGQAVLEGVMMRAPHAWGIAIRKPDGELAIHSEPLDQPSDKSPWKAWPFIRGIVTLGSAMVLGFKALRYSADVAMEDEKTASGEKLEMNGWVAAFNIALSLGFFIFMYKFLPFAAARSLRHWAPSDRQLRAVCPGGRHHPPRHLPRLHLAHLALERYPPRLPVPRRRTQNRLRLRESRPAHGRQPCSAIPPIIRAAAPAS